LRIRDQFVILVILAVHHAGDLVPGVGLPEQIVSIDPLQSRLLEANFLGFRFDLLVGVGFLVDLKRDVLKR
jgi:hypothetical protein